MDGAWPSVLAAVLTSSLVAAVVSGFLADRTERRKQLRDRQIDIAGDYAGAAMTALARLRDFKPPGSISHRNRFLYQADVLLQERRDAVKQAIDDIRALRGRVWILFPGRTSTQKRQTHGPTTASDWAEDVVAHLRRAEEVCDDFWKRVGENNLDPAALSRHESEHRQAYELAKSAAWHALDQFASTASSQLADRRRRSNRP